MARAEAQITLCTALTAIPLSTIDHCCKQVLVLEGHRFCSI